MIILLAFALSKLARMQFTTACEMKCSKVRFYIMYCKARSLDRLSCKAVEDSHTGEESEATDDS
jgi:hypothetical protein